MPAGPLTRGVDWALRSRTGCGQRRLRVSAWNPRQVATKHVDGQGRCHENRAYPETPIAMHTLPVRAGFGFTAVATVSFMVVSVSVISSPLPRCIRRGGQPDCSVRGDTKPAVQPIDWLPGPSKSPMRAAGWREKTRMPTAHGSRELNLTFIAFKRAEASSGDWPPDKNAIAGTAAGTARRKQLTVASATSSTVSC